MKVTVVIPNYNGRLLLEKNLPSVIAMMREGDECVVVDDCSTDDSVSFLSSSYPSVRIVRHEKNKRFAMSCNDGVAAAQNDLVLLLNSDVQPTQDLLTHLVPWFEKPEIFSVGCLEKNENGDMSGRSSAKFVRGVIVHQKAPFQQSGTSLWASGGSMMFRKKTYQELGGMDALFSPAYQEDVDLGYRAWKAGYTVLFDQDAIVKHAHETTNTQVFSRNALQLSSLRNSIVLFWKNVSDPRMILEHILWMPYHFIFDTTRTGGLYMIAFFQAILLSMKVLRERKRLQHTTKRTDQEVLRAGWE
jgi:GT2 family glycosyltransferase